MAVIVKYVVVRNGVELDKEFLVRKEADAYDKMLDAADSLAAFIREGDLEVKLADTDIDAIAVLLAKNAPQVTQMLKGIKPIEEPAGKAPSGDVDDKKAPASKANPKRK